MGNAQFVLVVAVFMVVATVMLTIPVIMPGPSGTGQTVTACRYERFCAAGDCAAPLPPDFRILAEDAGDGATLEITGRASPLSVTRRDAATIYAGSIEGADILTISISATGAFQSETRRGDSSAEMLAAGNGHCTPAKTGDEG
ncbi:MAG: hypothetical protein KF887_11740 [Paracoccaceae bacterium]|nr:MAG: hypothetical protein KF887_11740 [Paracoccaceae bacterium]